MYVGVVGLRPTVGRGASMMMFPHGDSLGRDGGDSTSSTSGAELSGVLGPLGRNVADVALFLDAMVPSLTATETVKYGSFLGAVKQALLPGSDG